MSGETRLSLFVGLDASKAKAEALGLKAEVEKLGRAAREAGQGAGAGAAGLSTLEKSLGATTRAGTAAAEVLAPISAASESMAQDLVLAGRGATEAATALTVLQAATREADAAIGQADQGLREASAATRVLDQALVGLKQEASQAGTAIGRVRDSTGRFVKGAQDAAGAATQFAGAADTAADSASRFGGAMPAVIPQTTKLGVETGKAAQSAGMMAAQWNDVVMMTLAGQSPMQLAIQQGTQMTQTFGNAGAGGALRMLGAGFVSMLNPMNLAVMAGIAAGAALVQAFMGAGEAVKSLDDAIADLETATDDFRDATSQSLDDLKEKYGQLTPEVMRLRREMSDLAGVRALQAAVETMKALRTETEGSWWGAFTDKAFTDENQIAQMLETQSWLPGETGVGATQENPLIGRFQAALDQAEAARGWDNQIAAVRELENIIIEAAGGIDNMSVKQAVLLAQYQAAEAALREQKALHEEASASSETMAEWLNRSLDAVAGIAGSDISGMISRALGPASQLGGLLEKAAGWWAQVGDAAQDVYQTSDGKLGRRSELFANSAGRGMPLVAGMPPVVDEKVTPPTTGVGGGSGGAKAETNAMADLIAKYQEETEALRALDPIQKALAQNHEALAGATEAERDQLITLIAEKERLTAVQDKIQQIGQLGKSAFTGLATSALTFRSALGNVLDGLAQMAASSAWDLVWGGGKTSGGGLGGLLGSIFGGGGSSGTKSKAGGGLGSVLGSLLGRADGGPIAGQGGPREDNILIRASAGEYMVNAQATAANLPLVEAINAGAGPRQLAAILGGMMSQPSLPAFADGGRIGGSAPSGWMRAATSQAAAAPASTGGEMAVTVNVEGARGNSEIADMVERGVRAGIEAFSRAGLPARIRQINADPRRMS